ncbi:MULTISPECIES: hypothetical protein [Bacillus]|jgi:hypothetical protein|uniref:Group-specific protein n=6 Tax=Bacillus cereus group TaxID=86661 RepID=A0A6L8PQG1_BACAN|nr:MULTISPECIES: hypothetical protein [Bacillus]ADY22629.1 hypothetical protein YBT020_16995 [Bacillus thuringiensis serovar finitimus YBT-020]EDX55850.1 hypothetical protein BCW_3390 [Bacillus cereus W]EJT18814.1 Group-specific protein [Bacillus anthracis str. UR-1]EXJ19199.1 hypothetical protein Y693_17135 [Bacillus anthracis str. 95014]OTX69393.1 hypothetical protein BK722_18005 [Bacillus thuringiensis serovar finitimus]UBR31388.1 hypothetical protein LCG60_05645 [Bacillus sp. SD-4]HDR449
MKVKFAVIKDENFNCSLLETKLLKTFKEVDCEADIVKVEDGIFENNGIQTHLLEITIHVTGKNIGYRSVSASIFIVLESLSMELFRITISIH